MSGHSKWSTIKRKKGALDAKRSKIFSRLVKEITVAVKEGGAILESNPRLRLAVQNAKGANMPKDNIQRAISKAEKDDSNLQELSFEGYAPGGVAVFIECLSDNNNRTVSNVRAVFNKRDGNLGTNGSLNFIFDRKGIFTIKNSGMNLEELELEMIDAGAEEIENVDGTIIISCELEDFGNINKKIEELGLEVDNAELQRIPTTTKKLGLEEAKKVLAIVDAFEELDDVQHVFHNLELTDELQAILENE